VAIKSRLLAAVLRNIQKNDVNSSRAQFKLYLIHVLAWTYHVDKWFGSYCVVNARKALKLLALTLVIVSSWSVGYVHAYSNLEVTNSLNKTRDALLDQRAHLKERADLIQQKIAEYSRQLDVVNSYLRDTDRNLSDVEDALRRVR
jgi:hypothetical protein